MFLSKNIALILLLIPSMVEAQSYKSKAEIDSVLSVTNELIFLGDLSQATQLALKSNRSSENLNYVSGEATSLTYLCYIYNYTDQFGKCVAVANKAIAVAKKTDDLAALFEAIRFKALSYNSLGYSTKAKKMINESFPITNKMADEELRISSRGFAYQGLSIIMNSLKKQDSSLYYNKKSLEEYTKIAPTSEHLLISAYNDIGSNFLDLKQLDSAEHYFKRALLLEDKHKRIVDKAKTLCELGNVFDLRNKHKIAQYYYNEGLNLTVQSADSETKVLLYLRLSESLEATNDFSEALKFKSLYVSLNDSIQLAKSRFLDLSFNEIIKEKETILNQTKSDLYRILIISALLFALCGYSIFVIYKNLKREKLTKKEIGSLLYEKMNQITDSSEEDKEISNEFDMKEIITLAMNDETSYHMKFQKVFPEFKEKLNAVSPTLVSSELKFATYLKLDFSAKEIARYTNSSVRAVEAKKYRLRKKLNIPSEIEINAWISKV